jgi:hypothetical protein
MEIHAHVPRMGRSLGHWFVEALLILVSVGVGFGAAQWRESRENHELTDRVLTGVRTEVEYNQGQLEQAMAKHREWTAALAKVDPAQNTKAAFEVMFSVRPSGDTNIGVPLRQAAWDTAVSTGALRLLDYDVASAFSEIYSYQTLMSANLTRLAQSVLYTPATFDPASRAASIQVMRWLLTEVEGNERFLDDLYKKHLPLLRRASPGTRFSE